MLLQHISAGVTYMYVTGFSFLVVKSQARHPMLPSISQLTSSGNLLSDYMIFLPEGVWLSFVFLEL